MHYRNERGREDIFMRVWIALQLCNFVLKRARLQNLLMLLVLLQWRQDSQWDRVFRKYMLVIGLYRLNLLLYTSLFSFQVPCGKSWWKKYLSRVSERVYCNMNTVCLDGNMLHYILWLRKGKIAKATTVEVGGYHHIFLLRQGGKNHEHISIILNF